MTLAFVNDTTMKYVCDVMVSLPISSWKLNSSKLYIKAIGVESPALGVIGSFLN